MTRLEELTGHFAGKLKLEKKRLKSYGTKPDSYSLAHAIAPDILAFLSKARWEEITDLIGWINKKYPKPRPKAVRKIMIYLKKERQQPLCVMKDQLTRIAEEKESKRPWKSLPSVEAAVKKSKSSKHKKRSESDGLRRKKKHKR